MRFSIITILSYAFFLLLPATGYAQKIEQERRVVKEKVSLSIRKALEKDYSGHKRMRYYEERNETGRFFEAKFCYQRSRYSVKYDTLGHLVEVERKIRLRQIPAPAYGKISEYFQEHFQRYSVRKVQERLYRGNLIGYEAELQGKTAEGMGYFEVQFDTSGQLERIRPIIQTPQDFIFF
ncbi:MAG: hypothetical protein KDC66_03960 [Phaeodactylibacter sp.]|nr:hypothetical protein [Phaeodactylibacter sp.]MCB9277003.1 hypothetical protein [Lewinellaceae bacterium]